MAEFGLPELATSPTTGMVVGDTHAVSTPQVIEPKVVLPEFQGGPMTPLPSGDMSVAPTPAPVPSEPTIGAALGGGGAITDGNTVDIAGQLAQITAEANLAQEGINALRDRENAGANFVAPDPLNPYLSIDQYSDPVDEDAVRRNQLRMFQSEIDAVNEAYDQLVREERFQGEGRLGSQRAIAARGGILGSDFAGAQKGRVQQFNTEQIRGLEGERAARIGQIQAMARQATQDEIANKRAARQQGYENYLAYLSGSEERKATNSANLAQAMLTQGITPEDIQDQIEGIASSAGVSAEDVIANYYNLAAANQSEAETEVLKAGETLVDTDGNVIFEVPAESNKKYFSTAGGVIEIDPATGENRFISGGGSGGGGGGSSASKYTATQRNKLEQAGLLNAPREEQLDYLFGDGSSEEEAAQIDEYLNLNRNQDPERLRQDLLNEGFSVSLINSYLETRPMSDVDITDTATALVSENMNPSFWKSRPTELEEAKANAIEQIKTDYESGALFDLFGERTKQLTQDEYNSIINKIQELSGRDTANQLIK